MLSSFHIFTCRLFKDGHQHNQHRLKHGNMGKNKPKGKKHKNVFQVANKHTKHKNKTKPVTTTLKHITVLKKEKVESLNKIFTEVQRDVTSISKSVAPGKKETNTGCQRATEGVCKHR
ncbi:hypothetical protein CgunFtcFv8_015576 [Champsocephalus gunnari]|uniref:Uncharacterized protein n=1 Tax=Champsocephalus gunnari TaxID=52237 RepID=A0AAN8H3F8_CHAGU|nr:hypothetical protein CgunFtcFv8_015576 [Champsocephalus gunnari]